MPAAPEIRKIIPLRFVVLFRPGGKPNHLPNLGNLAVS
jgi:hypothetical protein